MVLSRIWSAFILVAIVVAGVKYILSDNYKAIYNDMVVGKGGDTVNITTKPINEFHPNAIESFQTTPVFINKGIHYEYQPNSNNVKVYRIQETDGVIGTSKTAVDICIGLIGIMTLFMGFMSIAEKAGGINLLSRMIQPFSLNSSQKFLKTTLHLDI